MTDIKTIEGNVSNGYRLVNSKYPPIDLFDDVANAEEFAVIYEVQALTNPRLQNEIGNINLLPAGEIPFGIPGCSYACAPFTHVNPDGSRFSNGEYSVLYIADTQETALREVVYHQQSYWNKVDGLHYDRFVFRSLKCAFSFDNFCYLPHSEVNRNIYLLDDYFHSHNAGRELRESHGGIKYHSVRNEGAECFALFTPKTVSSIIQTGHYEIIFNEGTLSTNKITKVNSI